MRLHIKILHCDKKKNVTHRYIHADKNITCLYKCTYIVYGLQVVWRCKKQTIKKRASLFFLQQTTQNKKFKALSEKKKQATAT